MAEGRRGTSRKEGAGGGHGSGVDCNSHSQGANDPEKVDRDDLNIIGVLQVKVREAASFFTIIPIRHCGPLVVGAGILRGGALLDAGS